MQLYGLVRTGQLYATVFYNGSTRDLTCIVVELRIELIPLNHFFRRFQHSAILTAYIVGSSVCTSVVIARLLPI
jgi:hypothetical protein